MKQEYKALKPYLLLWATQTLSTLGSGMTSYALVLWLYRQTGSALGTALLSVTTYAPYVLMSVFAGALSDRWDKKRTMLVCDLLAALGTVAVLILLVTGTLRPWHLYLLNALSGLMNTVQQPAGEVAASLLVPRRLYQKTSGLRSFSQALNSVLTPVLATMLFALGGMRLVIAVDLSTFCVAFFTLWLGITIPAADRQAAGAGGTAAPAQDTEADGTAAPAQDAHPAGGAGAAAAKGPAGAGLAENAAEADSLLASARAGLDWLWRNPLVLKLIFFLAAINLVASAYTAALPALILPRLAADGEGVLGLVNACAGAATLAGSLLVTLLPAPKDRVRAVWLSLLVSMSTENFLLAFCKSPWGWCFGAVIGWLPIPYMSANLDVICRTSIPPQMQGRVYACRNTLQFFTIPLGYLLGGLLVDAVCEPLMAARPAGSLLVQLFGSGKGAGAALLFFGLALAGVAVCLGFGFALRHDHWQDPAGE